MHLFVTVIVVLSVASVGYGLNCYQCDYYSKGSDSASSPRSPNCGDPFNATGVDVSPDCVSCAKSKSTLTVAGVTITSIDRSYGPFLQNTTGASASCDSATLQGVSSTVCYCTTDSCNSAGKLAALGSTVLARFIVAPHFF